MRSIYANTLLKCIPFFKQDEQLINNIMPMINKFLKDNKNKLDNELILGIYSHLLADYYFNKYTRDSHVKEVEGNLVAILNDKSIELHRKLSATQILINQNPLFLQKLKMILKKKRILI